MNGDTLKQWFALEALNVAAGDLVIYLGCPHFQYQVL